MKQLRLTQEQIGSLCRALAHLCHAGIGAGDALALLAEDESGAEEKTVLQAMSRQADEGYSLAWCFRQAGCFPEYVCGLLEIGTCLGRAEETLRALADHYENRSRLERQLRDALLYPAVLLVILLAVVVILLVWVLPVFNDVYARLGSALTGVAGGLLALGGVLRRVMPMLCALLAAVVIFVVLLAKSAAVKERVLGFWRNKAGDRGVSRRIGTARFAQALSMALSSGMNDCEAVELASDLTEGNEKFRCRCAACLARLERGESLSAALRETELLSRAECRLLEAGIRSGSGATVMEQIARRLLEESEQELETLTGRIEPAVVVVMSVLVGLILLSVMLPLMHIMNAIG